MIEKIKKFSIRFSGKFDQGSRCNLRVFPPKYDLAGFRVIEKIGKISISFPGKFGQGSRCNLRDFPPKYHFPASQVIVKLLGILKKFLSGFKENLARAPAVI